MSSPIAIIKKSNLKKMIISFHRKASHNTRTNLLASLLADQIQQHSAGSEISCLDVGCGDMIIAERINELNPSTIWKCIDIHALPAELQHTDKWKKYSQFDGTNIPFKDKAFDIVIFCDVLHHTPENTLNLLKEASRVGKVVLIKDHFEYGFVSRQMLRLMDFIGNWSYGINVPKKYFSEKELSDICNKIGAKNVAISRNIDLYAHLPVVRNILSKKWQFIAAIKTE